MASWLFSVPVEQAVGSRSPGLEVRIEQGRYVMDAKSVNYSFGQLHRVFRKAFREAGVRERNPGSMLVLGLGAGSIPHIAYHELGLSGSMTGVEADPEVLRLGRTYFGLDAYERLRVEECDAIEFLLRDGNRYDLIAVDLFIDAEVPAVFRERDFFRILHGRLADRGLLLYNVMPAGPGEGDKLSGHLAAIFGNSAETHSGPNIVFHAERKEKQP